MNTQRNEDSAIDSIEHELYSPKAQLGQTEIHRTRSHKEISLPNSWGESGPVITRGENEKGMSIGAKLLFVSTLFLFAALVFSAWRVFSLRNVVSSSNIDMAADITPYIEGGEMTPLVVTLRNRNTAVLENANITLLYKQGNGSQDEEEKKQEKREIGIIKQNEYKKQDFSVLIYGAESETREVTLKLEYKVAGSNAIFNKVITTQVVLKASPISVSVAGPEKISIKQSGTYSFTVKNNSATSSIPSVLLVTLPNSFSTESTNPKPVGRSSAWAVPSLASGDSYKVDVTGFFDGKQGEVGTIQAKIGSQGQNPSSIGIVYASQVTDVTLRASPLTLGVSLAAENGTGGFLRYGDRATIVVSYSNSSSQALEDVSFKVALSGDAAIYNSIDPILGYYDSVAKVVTWDKAMFPDLAVLPPNAQGEVRIIVPIIPKGNNSPTLKVSVVGQASTKSTNDIIANLAKTFAVQGSATLEASTQYKNSSIINAGPIPPEPNKETAYAVRLKVSAQNNLSSSQVSFTLPAYVSWRNVVSSGVVVNYAPKTRTVTWDVGPLGQGKSVYVDIGLTIKPSQSHVGQSPAITSGIVLDAEEEVSKARLRTTLSPLTTAIKGESWSENPSVVRGAR